MPVNVYNYQINKNILKTIELNIFYRNKTIISTVLNIFPSFEQK